MSATRILTPLAFAAFAISMAALPTVLRAAPPSFNCAEAASRAEELICGDRQLALMDVEATRLFKLVRDSGDRRAEQKQKLNDDRARWLKVRDACWIAEDLRSCIIASYAVRIHSLRQNHAEARMSDEKGITRGPFVIRCKDLKPLKATFIRSDPPVSALQLPDSLHVGVGAGARYVERSDRGGLLFWTEGNTAHIRMPSGVGYDCLLQRK